MQLLQTWQTWLPLAIPPLLGALIGYVTNYVAIRMLFRPLRPWRLLGLRVPLTPGIIPAKRHELARRMGEMVGSHLLTSDDVGRALSREPFRRELEGAVREKLGQFLDRDLGPAAELVPADYQERFRDLVALARWKLVQAVCAYLASADFEARLRAFLRDRGDRLLARDLESFLDPERYRRVQEHLRGRIEAALASPAAERAVGGFVDAKTEQLLRSERPLRELLPEDLVEVLLAQLEKEIPPLLEKFGGMLYDPEFRARLAERSKKAVEGFLDSLDGLSGLLAGFINLEKVYARIPDLLDQAGEEVSRWLRRETTQREAAALVRERIDDLLDRPLNAYLEKVPYEKVAGMRQFLRERSVAVLQSPRSAETVMGWTERGVERLKDRSFGSLLGRVLPEGGVERGREELAARLLELVRSPGARAALDEVLAGQAERWLFRRPLGKLSTRLPADAREELEGFLLLQLEELLRKEVPPLVETLNVSRMVEEKVNALDLLEVEGLLMGIMREQFKYINLFGALLGFLIGLANLLLLRLV